MMDPNTNNVNSNDRQINYGTTITSSTTSSNILSPGKKILPNLSSSLNVIPTHHFRIPTTASPPSIAAADSLKNVENDGKSKKDIVPHFLNCLSDIAAKQLKDLELSQNDKKDLGNKQVAPPLEHVISKPLTNRNDPTTRIERVRVDLPKRKASKSAVSCKKGSTSKRNKASPAKGGPSTSPPSPGGKQKEKRQRTTKPIKDRSNLRKGKWTVEEEEYTSRIIHHFRAGLLTLPEGMTLRSYLASKLTCDPMRITKKFAGASCLGKRIYHLCERSQITINDIEMARIELAQLEQRFRLRVEHGQSGLPLPPRVSGSILGHSGQSLLNGVMQASHCVAPGPSTFVPPLGAPNLNLVGLNPLLLQAMALQQHQQQQQQQNSVPWLAMQTPMNLALLTNLIITAQQSQTLAQGSPEPFKYDGGLCQPQTTAAPIPQVAPTNVNIQSRQVQAINNIAVESILPPSGTLQNNIGKQLQGIHNISSIGSLLPTSGILHSEIGQKNTKLTEAIPRELHGFKCAVPSKDITINKQVDDQLSCKRPTLNTQKNTVKGHTQEDEDAGRTLLEFLRELQQNHSKAVSEDRSQRGSAEGANTASKYSSFGSANSSSDKNLIPSSHLRGKTQPFVNNLSRRKNQFQTSPHHNNASVVTASINDSVTSRGSVSPMKTSGNAFIHQGREVAVQYFESSSSLGTSVCKTSDISRGGTESSSYSERNMEQDCSEESDSSKSQIESFEGTVDKDSSAKGPVRKRFKRSVFTSRNVEDHNTRMDALRKDDVYSKRYQSQAKVADP